MDAGTSPTNVGELRQVLHDLRRNDPTVIATAGVTEATWIAWEFTGRVGWKDLERVYKQIHAERSAHATEVLDPLYNGLVSAATRTAEFVARNEAAFAGNDEVNEWVATQRCPAHADSWEVLSAVTGIVCHEIVDEILGPDPGPTYPEQAAAVRHALAARDNDPEAQEQALRAMLILGQFAAPEILTAQLLDGQATAPEVHAYLRDVCQLDTAQTAATPVKAPPTVSAASPPHGNDHLGEVPRVEQQPAGSTGFRPREESVYLGFVADLPIGLWLHLRAHGILTTTHLRRMPLPTARTLSPDERALLQKLLAAIEDLHLPGPVAFEVDEVADSVRRPVPQRPTATSSPADLREPESRPNCAPDTPSQRFPLFPTLPQREAPSAEVGATIRSGRRQEFVSANPVEPPRAGMTNIPEPSSPSSTAPMSIGEGGSHAPDAGVWREHFLIQPRTLEHTSVVVLRDRALRDHLREMNVFWMGEAADHLAAGNVDERFRVSLSVCVEQIRSLLNSGAPPALGPSTS